MTNVDVLSPCRSSLTSMGLNRSGNSFTRSKGRAGRSGGFCGELCSAILKMGRRVMALEGWSPERWIPRPRGHWAGISREGLLFPLLPAPVVLEYR